IFERIRLSTDWSQAVVIAALQSAILFVLAFAAARGKGAPRDRSAQLRLFQARSGVVPILAATFFLLLGYLQGLPMGFGQLANFFELSSDLWIATLGTFT